MMEDCAIAIRGVNAGYRTPKDEEGNLVGKPFLIPDLKHFATQDRRVTICFDRDQKPETVQRVRTAIKRMGKLLAVEECDVRVIDLPGPEKGVDDFVVSQRKVTESITLEDSETEGEDVFYKLYYYAETLELWQIEMGNPSSRRKILSQIPGFTNFTNR
jgi:hypothetical protein